MIKRPFIRIIAVAAFAGVFAACVHAADLKDPNEIIKKSQTYALSLDSYSFVVRGEGWDLNPEANAKRQSAAAGAAGKKFGSVKSLAGDIKKDADKNQANTKPIYRRYECVYKFKKPYLLQMHVNMSDYVPKIIYGSNMTYRPDQDPKVWWFKPRISPIAISRPIDSESGDMLYSVLVLNNAMIEAMSKDAKPVFKGTAKVADKVGDRDAYVVEFFFDKAKKKLKPHAVDVKKWGIAADAQKKFADEVNGYVFDTVNRIVFYFDKNSLLVIQRESYGMDNKMINRKVWREIKVNNLTEKDF
jgi:hypothetical protein